MLPAINNQLAQVGDVIFEFIKPIIDPAEVPADVPNNFNRSP